MYLRYFVLTSLCLGLTENSFAAGQKSPSQLRAWLSAKIEAKEWTDAEIDVIQSKFPTSMPTAAEVTRALTPDTVAAATMLEAQRKRADDAEAGRVQAEREAALAEQERRRAIADRDAALQAKTTAEQRHQEALTQIHQLASRAPSTEDDRSAKIQALNASGRMSETIAKNMSAVAASLRSVAAVAGTEGIDVEKARAGAGAAAGGSASTPVKGSVPARMTSLAKHGTKPLTGEEQKKAKQELEKRAEALAKDAELKAARDEYLSYIREKIEEIRNKPNTNSYKAKQRNEEMQFLLSGEIRTRFQEARSLLIVSKKGVVPKETDNEEERRKIGAWTGICFFVRDESAQLIKADLQGQIKAFEEEIRKGGISGDAPAEAPIDEGKVMISVGMSVVVSITKGRENLAKLKAGSPQYDALKDSIDKALKEYPIPVTYQLEGETPVATNVHEAKATLAAIGFSRAANAKKKIITDAIKAALGNAPSETGGSGGAGSGVVSGGGGAGSGVVSGGGGSGGASASVINPLETITDTRPSLVDTINPKSLGAETKIIMYGATLLPKSAQETTVGAVLEEIERNHTSGKDTTELEKRFQLALHAIAGHSYDNRELTPDQMREALGEVYELYRSNINMAVKPKLRKSNYMRHLFAEMKKAFPEGHGNEAHHAWTKEQLIFNIKDMYRVYNTDMRIHGAADYYTLHHMGEYLFNVHLSATRFKDRAFPAPNIPTEWLQGVEFLGDDGLANAELYPHLKETTREAKEGMGAIIRKEAEKKGKAALSAFLATADERKPTRMADWVLRIKAAQLMEGIRLLSGDSGKTALSQVKIGLDTMSLEELRALQYMVGAYSNSDGETGSLVSFKDQVLAKVVEIPSKIARNTKEIADIDSLPSADEREMEKRTKKRAQLTQDTQEKLDGKPQDGSKTWVTVVQNWGVD